MASQQVNLNILIIYGNNPNFKKASRKSVTL